MTKRTEEPIALCSGTHPHHQIKANVIPDPQTLQNLADQICASQSTRDVTYENDNKYTSQLLLDAIETALSKAELPRPE